MKTRTYGYSMLPDSRLKLVRIERNDGAVKFSTSYLIAQKEAAGMSEDEIWDSASTEEEMEAMEDRYYFKQTPFGLVFVTPEGTFPAYFNEQGRPYVPGISPRY